MSAWTPKESHAVSRERIEAVLDGTPYSLASFERFEGGVINPLYIIETQEGEQLVLRLAHPNWTRIKTENEIVVMRFIAQNTSVPVPAIIAADSTGERIGYEYLLMERVEGDRLSDIFDGLSGDERRGYLEQLARYMAQWRSFPFDRIGSFSEGMRVGPLSESKLGPFDSFGEYLRASIRDLVPHVREDPRFVHLAEPLERFANEALGYREPVQLLLTHGDVTSKNVIVRDGRIEAVLDWEWAKAAPADEDLYGLDWMSDDERRFMTERLGTPDGYADRTRFYDALHATMSLAYYRGWFVGREAEGERFVLDEQARLEELLDVHGPAPLGA